MGKGRRARAKRARKKRRRMAETMPIDADYILVGPIRVVMYTREGPVECETPSPIASKKERSGQ
jgi:hypothetical protein